jgi:hypothetical protein
MSKRSTTGAQLAHALSASHCLLTDWRPTRNIGLRLARSKALERFLALLGS